METIETLKKELSAGKDIAISLLDYPLRDIRNLASVTTWDNAGTLEITDSEGFSQQSKDFVKPSPAPKSHGGEYKIKWS